MRDAMADFDHAPRERRLPALPGDLPVRPVEIHPRQTFSAVRAVKPQRRNDGFRREFCESNHSFISRVVNCADQVRLHISATSHESYQTVLLVRLLLRRR